MSALTSNLTMQDQHRRYNALKNHSDINTVIKFIQDEMKVLACALAIYTCYRSHIAVD